MKSVASNSRRPQVGKSGGKPRPRKLSALSVMIAVAMPRVAETIIGDITFGRICRRIILPGRVPIERAAKTNSCSFNAKTSPRTIRAVGIHEVIPMAVTIRIKIPVSGPNELERGWRNSITITSNNGNKGRARNKSVRRINSPSIRLK